MAIQQGDDGCLRECALFAGAGGGILGAHLLGQRTVVAVERDAYAAQVLAQRQNDGCLRPFPIWSDVTTFDGKPWAGTIDIVSAGFPCQDISVAGGGAGIEGLRSGLWKHVPRIVRETGAWGVWLENSPALTSRGLGVVLADLAEMGFDAKWGVLGAGHIGAMHLRERIWIFAADYRKKRIQRRFKATVQRIEGLPWIQDGRGPEDLRAGPDLPDPLVRGDRNGVAWYVDRISAIGNGQFPAVAATAWKILAA